MIKPLNGCQQRIKEPACNYKRRAGPLNSFPEICRKHRGNEGQLKWKIPGMTLKTEENLLKLIWINTQDCDVYFYPPMTSFVCLLVILIIWTLHSLCENTLMRLSCCLTRRCWRRTDGTVSPAGCRAGSGAEERRASRTLRRGPPAASRSTL